jgi:hypothetical protein
MSGIHVKEVRAYLFLDLLSFPDTLDFMLDGLVTLLHLGGSILVLFQFLWEGAISHARIEVDYRPLPAELS